MTLAELYREIDGNYEAMLKTLPMEQLIARVLGKLPDDPSCGQMVSAWAERDARGVFEGAHGLKGAAANLHLDSLSREAGAVADEFRPGTARSWSDEEVSRRVAELAAHYADVCAKIRAF